jgi:hypothetical protein
VEKIVMQKKPQKERKSQAAESMRRMMAERETELSDYDPGHLLHALPPSEFAL